MADFDFSDIAARYLQKRMDPINQLINDPGQYLQNRVEDNIGVKFDNTATNAPSTMPPLASQQTMAPVDYSLGRPQQGFVSQAGSLDYGPGAYPQPPMPQQAVQQASQPGSLDYGPGAYPQPPMPQQAVQQASQPGSLDYGPGAYPQPPMPQQAAQQQVQPRPTSPRLPQKDAGAGRGFVNPEFVRQEEVTAAMPPSPMMSSAQYTAQQESGSNPNIGYHYQPDASGQRRSSAYGKYGITAGAYSDIQRTDPYFANRPITTLTQEEQDRAFGVYRNNLAGQLQTLNVEPTESNLKAAHVIGAQGLSNYMNKKDEYGRPYLSPQAQNANGGYDKLRSIVESRLAGGNAPASAAAGQTAPTQTAPTTETMTGQGLTVGGMNQAQLQALNSKDPKELFKLAYNPTTSPGIQRMALDNLYKDTNTRKNVADAEAAIDKRLANGDITGLTRDMNKKGDEGSYLKAILFKRLGLDSLAQQEMEKISPTLTATTIDYDGKTYIGQYDKNGNLRSAKETQTGESVDSPTLLKMAGNTNLLGKGTSLSAEVYVDKAGNRYRSGYNAQGKAALVNIQGGAPFRGNPKDLTLQSIGTTEAKANIGLITDLKKKHGSNVLDALKEYEYGTGPLSAENRDQFLKLYGMTGGMPGSPQAPAGQQPAGEQPAGEQPPPTPLPAGRDPNGAYRGDRSDALTRQQPAPATGNMNKPLVQLKAEQEAYKKKLAEEAEVMGKDLGTTRANQGKAEANADYLLTKINQLTSHPGFKMSVGVADIGERTTGVGIPIPFGATVAGLFPGTDVSDFRSRFDEVKGQSFLQAIENLRGMGALSNLEGETATRAIQRMSTSQSEKEFKAAAKDFQEVIQRGIDRSRVKLGQEPKYGTPSASETAEARKQESTTKPLNKEDQAAIEWARQNPNDPRAVEIKKRLGL